VTIEQLLPSTTSPLTVRSVRRADFAGIVKVQGRAGPLYLPWSLGQLESHLRRFPEGQLVAVRDGAIVGACASLKLRLAPGEQPAGWAAATGNGYFHSHDPAGDVLYVASMAIDPRDVRVEVRRALDDAVLRLALDEHASRVLLPVRLPAYPPLAARLTPEAYLARLEEGVAPDPVFEGLRAIGFRSVGLLADHQGEPRSGDHLAALMEWQAGAA
jgi:ribosomal protein S18 acetylase RimI-like enzyme